MENSNGIRLIASIPLGGARQQMNTVNPVIGEQLFQQFTTLEAHSIGETVECYAAQNSGVNIDVYPYLYTFILRRL